MIYPTTTAVGQSGSAGAMLHPSGRSVFNAMGYGDDLPEGVQRFGTLEPNHEMQGFGSMLGKLQTGGYSHSGAPSSVATPSPRSSAQELNSSTDRSPQASSPPTKKEMEERYRGSEKFNNAARSAADAVKHP